MQCPSLALLGTFFGVPDFSYAALFPMASPRATMDCWWEPLLVQRRELRSRVSPRKPNGVDRTAILYGNEGS